MATIMDKKGNVKKPTTITNCKLRDLRNFFMAYPSTKHVLINGLSDIHIDFDEDGNILLKNIVSNLKENGQVRQLSWNYGKKLLLKQRLALLIKKLVIENILKLLCLSLERMVNPQLHQD